MGRARGGRPARSCRACRGALSPYPGPSAATCPGCWARLPVSLRAAAVIAYGRRRVDRGRHIEAQAGILQWCADQATALSSANGR